MAFCVYILRCSDGLYYTGQTDDLERRLAEHKRGEIDGFTAARLPVELMWCEMFPTRMEAREAEYRIKPWSREERSAVPVGLAGAEAGCNASEGAGPSHGERIVRASTSLGMDGYETVLFRTVHPERSRGTH